MRTQTVCGVLAVLVALGAPARAAEGVPDPAIQREFSAKLLVCNACHGDRGTPKNGAIPIIWGQQESYLAKQLQDFDHGDRANEIMAWMAKTLEPAEKGVAAASFAKKDWPARPVAAAATQAPAGITVCGVCHQQNFMGTLRVEGMTAPRLAGQSYDYLLEQMRRFADGERNNSADMAQIMKAVSPADREAMARYLSGL